MNRFIAIGVFLLFSCGQARAQDAQKLVSLPDSIMEQVFRHIVESNFKTSQEYRTAYFFNRGIKWEWFPEIENIYFVLLSESEIRGRDVFFVKDLERNGDEFEISYGSGEPYCSASGQTWRIKIEGYAAKLRPVGGWGSGCSRGAGK